MRSSQILSAVLTVLPFLVTPCKGFSVHQKLHSTSAAFARRRERLETSVVLDSDQESQVSDKQPLTQGKGDLPPVLQQIADERQEFNMNLGKAMDTLRKDIPYALRRSPDFSIYHPDITVIDPSGVRLTGLDSYKSALTFFQTFIRFWFSPSSRLQYRIVYDFCRSSIRVSWNIVLIPKVPLGRPLFLDGISHYKLESSSGKIIEHKIENLIMNDTPVAPPYGMLSLLQQDIMGGSGKAGVPVGVGVGAMSSS